MTNPFNEIKKEIIGGLVIIILVIAFVGIYEALKTMPGSTPQTQAIAEQGEQFTIWAALLYLGLPSMAIIGLFIWIFRTLKGSTDSSPQL